ncbi:hypothetical protein KRR38_06205 [Novosphingobium sp. G106]|uniref:hypothetical protein n=1 Tax=Novosphingobium sp. G106 TaxID=2849500 RepID=UPI001C2CCE01|nr:hypothetical protein [Novosphingobium sp. G106]MBV1687276.1 hypothetical protein [Novosphingobium sp. G106]
MNNNNTHKGLAVAIALLTTACNGQTPEEKAAADARAVAQVEAIQKIKPPVQPLELGAVNPNVRRLYKLGSSDCAFATDPNPGAFPLLIVGGPKAVLLIDGEPAIFAADNGSPEVAAGVHAKYVGRSYSAQFARQPDRVTIRDRFERIVYQAPGTLSCRG